MLNDLLQDYRTSIGQLYPRLRLYPKNRVNFTPLITRYQLSLFSRETPHRILLHLCIPNSPKIFRGVPDPLFRDVTESESSRNKTNFPKCRNPLITGLSLYSCDFLRFVSQVVTRWLLGYKPERKPILPFWWCKSLFNPIEAVSSTRPLLIQNQSPGEFQVQLTWLWRSECWGKNYNALHNLSVRRTLIFF